MSKNRLTTTPNAGNGTRDAILDRLHGAIEDIHQAIEDNEPTSVKEERLQLDRYQKLGYLANQFRKLKRDTDIDTMAAELELLKTTIPEEER